MNVEDLDFAGRRCPVKAKGARSKARRRGQAREDYVLETVYWDADTARLMSRLLKGRTRGPVFVTRKAGERPPLLQAVPRGHLGADQPVRPPATRAAEPGCHRCPLPWNHTTARRVPPPAAAPGAHAARGTVGPL